MTTKSHPLVAMNIVNKLAKTPINHPKHSVSIKDGQQQEITLSDPKAARALLILMNQHATIGGAAAHWGGPSAFAEIISALHGFMFKKANEAKKEWYELFHFVNDAGHAENGIYALRANYGFDGLTFNDLKKFRSIESKLTGHGEAHLNPEGVLISNGPLGSGLPMAQGLCMADKLAQRSRATICVLSDGAAMEGEAKEAMSAIPGLAKKNKMNPFILVISDNDTKLGGRISDDTYSMAPTFQSLSTLGFEVITIENGHDLEKIYHEIEKAHKKTAQDSSTPIALILKTIKGKGVKKTEMSASGGHGYHLKAYDDQLLLTLEEIYDQKLPEEFRQWAQDILDSKPPTDGEKKVTIPKEKIQDGVARALISMRKKGLPVFSLSADLQSSTGVKGFHQAYPDSYIDLGIAESNMISAAIGLSKGGFIPIVDTFAQFGITKGNLPLMMAGLSAGPLIAFFSHTGFQDAADGASHQATTYYGALAGIPHIDLIHLSCSQEAEDLVTKAIDDFYQKRQQGLTPNSTIFFLGRETHPLAFNEKIDFPWKKASVLHSGKDVTIVAAGPMVQVAMNAIPLFENEGIHPTIISHSFVNHIDTETLNNEIAKTKGKIITLEDHQIIGGLGQMIAHALVLNHIPFKMKSLGIEGTFGQSAYTASELYAKNKLTAKDLIIAFHALQTN